MKIFFTLFIVVGIMLAAYPFFDASKKTETLRGLPWQIEVLQDGSTQVFGLHVGVSRLSDALKILGDDMEVAIVAATGAATDSAINSATIGEAGSLEMYYGHYRAGLLSGKLVLQTDISAQKIQNWRTNALRFEYMETGLAKKYILSPDDLPQVYDETIVGLTFIPSVNLDEKVILTRFGEPAQRVSFAGVTHYLYPAKGLDIALHEDSKEVLQYVTPDAFEQLVKPLL